MTTPNVPKPATAAHPLRRRPAAGFALTLVTLAALVACDNNSDQDEPLPTVLSGTAAIGAPMAGATVTVIDGDPATPDPAPVTAGSNGSYTIDVSSLKAPLLVRASATIDGEAVQHVAVLAALNANSSNTANVTPLTTAVATLVAPGGDAAALTTPATLAAAATATQVGNATALLVNTLASDPGTAALLGSNFNPMTTAFTANGTGVDAALDRVSVVSSGGTVQITNLTAAAGTGGVPAPVTLTPGLVATPSAAPTLPASVPTGNLPTAAELAALGAKYEACLALPISQRVTLDANGTATAVLGICNFAPADWKSNGRTFTEDLGQFTFAKNLLTGAKLGAGQVVLALNPEGLTDAKEHKHPYCNDNPCVVARWPLTTASGRPLSSDWVLAKVNGAWNFVGNQRPFRTFVEPRLQRRIAMNRTPTLTGGAGDYFFKDRYESSLRLVFDIAVGDTSDVRAVRFTGPGLPAAGVVSFRSQRCSTDDRMAISYQNGTTRVVGGTSNGVPQFWNNGGGDTFVLAAANLDGTVLATPTPVNTATSASFQDFSPVAISDLPGTVPAWSRYKVEVFRFSSTTPDVPDQVIYLRTGSAALENPGAGAGVPWPTLSTAYATDHLTPTGAQAAAQASLANTLSWTVPSGTFVTSGYLFGQDFLTLSNGVDPAASYGYRGRLDHEPAAFGDTTAAAWRIASPAAGTALSPSTQTSGSNPNPRCPGDPRVPALTASTSDYREVGLFIRSADRQVRQAIWYWDN